MVYVIGDQQDLHQCKQFFNIFGLVQYPCADRFEHINFGKVQGMSMAIHRYSPLTPRHFQITFACVGHKIVLCLGCL
jgi:hypothetical protein